MNNWSDDVNQNMKLTTIQPTQLPAPKNYQEVEQARAIAEIQGALVSAQVCPRDIQYTERMIENECSLPEFAALVEYKLPVGGKDHYGASIRTMEMIAGYYGNIRSGYEEIRWGKDDQGTFTDCKAIAWDLKTNNFQFIPFRVYHFIITKKEGKKEIKDPFEISRLIRNHAARAQREALKKVIPRYLVQKAIKIARETVLAKIKSGQSLPEIVRNMLKQFAILGVKQDQLEKYVGTTYENFTAEHVADLRAVYRSIVEDECDASEFFDIDNKSKSKPKAKAELDDLLKETGDA